MRCSCKGPSGGRCARECAFRVVAICGHRTRPSTPSTLRVPHSLNEACSQRPRHPHPATTTTTTHASVTKRMPENGLDEDFLQRELNTDFVEKSCVMVHEFISQRYSTPPTHVSRHIDAFANALSQDYFVDHDYYPDSPQSPSSFSLRSGASIRSGAKSPRIRKVSALSDFAPVNLRVKKRRAHAHAPHVHPKRQEWLFVLVRWPLLVCPVRRDVALFNRKENSLTGSTRP